MFLPVFILIFLLAASGCAPGPFISSPYKALYGTLGNNPRPGAHPGVDFGEAPGAPVLAAADGTVANVGESSVGCGNTVLIEHRDFARFTLYCHLLERAPVKVGQKVTRGEVVGRVGQTGRAATPHVHLQLCSYFCAWGNADGNLAGTEDPLSVTIGCFDAKKVSPNDRLALTYPVKC